MYCPGTVLTHWRVCQQHFFAVTLHGAASAGLDCGTSQPVAPTGACTVMPPQNATQAICDPGRIFSPSSSTQALALLAWRDSLQAGGSNPLFSAWGTGDPCAMLWPGVVCASGAVSKIQVQPPSTRGNNITYTDATGSANWTALASLTGLTHLELQASDAYRSRASCRPCHGTTDTCARPHCHANPMM
jgi:hypothetical protein